MKETSAELAALAANVMRRPAMATPDEVKRLAGCVLAQRETDTGSVLHALLVNIRGILQEKGRIVRRSELLPMIAEVLGE